MRFEFMPVAKLTIIKKGHCDEENNGWEFFVISLNFKLKIKTNKNFEIKDI